MTSLDDEPLSKSRYILITAIARRIPGYSQSSTLQVRASRRYHHSQDRDHGLQLLALGADGKVVDRLKPKSDPEGVTFDLPTRRGTHWYALKVAGARRSPASNTQVQSQSLLIETVSTTPE